MSLYQHQEEKIELIAVPGSWIPSQSVVPPEKANNENVLKTFELLQSKRASPDNDILCIVPVMPAVPPTIDESVLIESKKHVEVSAPLKGKKSPYSDKTSKGYRSGSRSCIALCRKIKSGDSISSNDWVIASDKDGSKYVLDSEAGTVLVRIKGCGMWSNTNDLPFPAITLMDSKSRYAPEGKSVSEIRGVCFENTSCTEMISTAEIEENLNKIGLYCGNHPLGFWIFGKLENDPSPLITKTVSIFETVGDRRLESHLFPGLDNLISKKFDQSFADRVIDLIRPLYAQENFPSNNCKTLRKRGRITAYELKKKIADGSFFNLNDFQIDEFSDDVLRKNGLVPTYDIYEKIKDLDKDFINLVKVYGRIGFEIGRIIGVVHRTGYLWGSYTDHREDQFHVNAHTDNLVVLSKEICTSNKKKIQIIAPVDFDMSFKQESSINFWRKPPFPDPAYCTANMVPEIEYMADAIGGFYATYEQTSNFFKPRKQPPGSLCNILWMMRDCAVYEYYQGYQKINSDSCKGNDISIDDIYNIVNEGLNETIYAKS